MDYIQFKEVFRVEFEKELSRRGCESELIEQEVFKCNCKKDALMVRCGKISPQIYFDAAYDDFEAGSTLAAVVERYAELVTESPDVDIQPIEVDFKKTLKENVIFSVINKAENEEMLKDMPYRDFQDLAIIYRCVVSMDNNSMGTFRVTHEHLESTGLTESEIYALAYTNTIRNLGVKVRNMADTLRSLGLTEEAVAEEDFASVSMIIATNDQGINGASVMLYDSVLAEVAEGLKCDLWILPSSVHEVLLVPCDNESAAICLQRMVYDVNRSMVAREDFLSNNVYHYNKELHKVTLA